MKELCYVMLEPGFAENHLVIDEIRKRIRNAKLNILRSGHVKYDRETLFKQHEGRKTEQFCHQFEDYLTCDYAYGMIVEGKKAISKINKLIENNSKIGPEPGDFRYDITQALYFNVDNFEHIIYASDSVESAQKDIAIFEDLMDKKNLNL